MKKFLNVLTRIADVLLKLWKIQVQTVILKELQKKMMIRIESHLKIKSLKLRHLRQHLTHHNKILSLKKTTQPQRWIKPCDGPITSGFGKRVAPVPGASEYHNGWDIGVSVGTPVSTIADGKVIAVGPARGYGNWVAIDHGIINGIKVTSEYGHISSWNVSYGQTVKQGQVIAKSGNTGTSSGPHLHITIREGNFQGKAVDPGKYIKIGF